MNFGIKIPVNIFWMSVFVIGGSFVAGMLFEALEEPILVDALGMVFIIGLIFMAGYGVGWKHSAAVPSSDLELPVPVQKKPSYTKMGAAFLFTAVTVAVGVLLYKTGYVEESYVMAVLFFIFVSYFGYVFVGAVIYTASVRRKRRL